MYLHVPGPQQLKQRPLAEISNRRDVAANVHHGFVDRRAAAVVQQKMQDMADHSPRLKQLKAVQSSANRIATVVQRVQIGNINCPNIGAVTALGNAIHQRFQADYIQNGAGLAAHPTWLRGYEYATATGQRADISLRTPGLNLVRSVGEIKPLGGAAAGAAQIATHLGNMPANGLNAANPVIVDPGWAAGAAFPVTALDPAGVSPSGNVNLTPVAATPGLYTYNG